MEMIKQVYADPESSVSRRCGAITLTYDDDISRNALLITQGGNSDHTDTIHMTFAQVPDLIKQLEDMKAAYDAAREPVINGKYRDKQAVLWVVIGIGCGTDPRFISPSDNYVVLANCAGGGISTDADRRTCKIVARDVFISQYDPR